MRKSVVTGLAILGSMAPLAVYTGPVASAASPSDLGFKGTITFAPGANYLPSPTAPNTELPAMIHEWEKLHPGITVRLIDIPGSDESQQRQWTVTELTAGTAPDIIYQNAGDYVNADIGKGWYVGFDKYLKQANPYDPSVKTWGSEFAPAWLDALRSEDGQLYSISPDTIGIGMAYNTTIWKKAGLNPNKPPQSFGQLIKDLQAIKKAGYIPFMSTDWQQGSLYGLPLEAVIWHDELSKMDTLAPGKPITYEEELRAIKLGIYSASNPRFAAYLKLLKKLMSFEPSGYAGLSSDQTRQEWMEGKVGVLDVETSNHYLQDLGNPLRKFNIKVFSYPQLTKKDSPYGGVPMAGEGDAGYATNWWVTSSATKDNSLKACINLLQFLTSPKADKSLTNASGMLPGVLGVKVPANEKPYFQKAQSSMKQKGYVDWHEFNPSHNLSLAYQTKLEAAEENYFTGHQSLQQTLGQIQQYLNQELQTYGSQFDQSKW